MSAVLPRGADEAALTLDTLAGPAQAEFLPTRLLRDGQGITAEILADREVDALVPRLLSTAAGAGSLFGLAIGLPEGVAQALISGIKLPIILLGSAGVALPVLLVCCSLAGKRLRSAQISALLLQALSTAAVTMAALAPLAVVAWLTASTFSDNDWYVYRRAVAAFTVVAALGGLVGASRLLRALPWLAVLPWSGLFGVAGMQLMWLLRPVVGRPDGLVLLRAVESNGLAQVLVLISTVLR